MDGQAVDVTRTDGHPFADVDTVCEDAEGWGHMRRSIQTGVGSDNYTRCSFTNTNIRNYMISSKKDVGGKTGALEFFRKGIAAETFSEQTENTDRHSGNCCKSRTFHAVFQSCLLFL